MHIISLNSLNQNYPYSAIDNAWYVCSLTGYFCLSSYTTG